MADKLEERKSVHLEDDDQTVGVSLIEDEITDKVHVGKKSGWESETDNEAQ